MSQLNISRGCVESFSLFLPNKKEQTAIGNFFQQLDQSIVLQQQKYTQTQNLKKAMLEKMFPKAGRKQPEIRLKGFGGDWEEFKLGQIYGFNYGSHTEWHYSFIIRTDTHKLSQIHVKWWLTQDLNDRKSCQSY